jgi:alpha-tubulin suppressor-like RCC1 family protein
MTRIINDLEAHYETHEVPFGRSYEWHPENIIVECDCGERVTLTASSSTSVCWCGTDHSVIIGEIQKREGRLSNKIIHPWYHDTRVQAEQHKRDEAAYPKGSPWRYNDITSESIHGK